MSAADTLPTPPDTLPIFPLTGALLLPGGHLPLYIFEPRYCAMVEDTLGRHGCIGMVQPLVADPRDNRGPVPEDPPEAGADTPRVYPVGCVGHVDRYESMPMGRFVLLLRGIGRFRIVRELEQHRGYRRVDARYDEFLIDREEIDSELDPTPLLAALERFGRAHSVTIELDQLQDVSGRALLNSVASSLPFAPAEQQALLEAPDLDARRDMLLALLDMGLKLDGGEVSGPPN